MTHRRPRFPLWVGLPAVLVATALQSGCSNFRKLDSDIAFMSSTYILSALVENAGAFGDVYGIVVEWDPERGRVLSADFAPVGPLGVFAFFVKSARNQYVLAFSDRNHDRRYDRGEPSWIHTDAEGRPAPVAIPAIERRARLQGRLSEETALPPEMLAAAQAFLGARTPEEAETGWDVPVALGDVADLTDPRFSAVRGEQGLWQPASFPRETGIGIFFLEPYDARRTPVLFVHGAAGSPQDWRTFFSSLDRSRFQPWFYLYPTGRRLSEVADSLNRVVELLQSHFGFARLDVVAHSMGGLVARSFLNDNVLRDGNRYISRFVSISTPWGGHEAAAMGVRFSPAVVPSWRDMVAKSPFQKAILAPPLKGHVSHLLIYGFHSSRSFVLPEENDGTVSVKSQLAPAARANAVQTVGFDADHVGILSRPDVIETVEAFLGEAR